MAYNHALNRGWATGAIAMAAALLASCGNDPIETQTPSNGAKAQMIAVVDGCHVWRMADGFTTVYLTKCGSDSVATSIPPHWRGKHSIPGSIVAQERN